MHLIFTSHNTDDDDLVSECASTPEYQVVNMLKTSALGDDFPAVIWNSVLSSI